MQDVVMDEKLAKLVNIPFIEWSQEDYYYYYDTNPKEVLNPASGVLQSNFFFFSVLFIPAFRWGKPPPLQDQHLH